MGRTTMKQNEIVKTRRRKREVASRSVSAVIRPVAFPREIFSLQEVSQLVLNPVRHFGTRHETDVKYDQLQEFQLSFAYEE